MPVDEFAEFQFVHNHSGRIFRLFFCSQYYYRLPRVWPLFQNTSRAPFSGGKRRVYELTLYSMNTPLLRALMISP